MTQEARSEQAVITEQHGKVLLVTLNRPQRLNALDESIKDGFLAALDQAGTDPGVGAVVITGAGRAFSAGADLQRFAEMHQAGDEEQLQEFTHVSFPEKVIQFAKPMIAAINGPAVGWGFTMPLICDIRLAAREAEFSAAFVKVGVTPEFGSAFLLPRIVGLGRAMELVLTCRTFGPQEALAMGLVSEVLDQDRLVPRALGLAAEIAGRPGPAVRMAKEILRRGAETPLGDLLETEMEFFRRAMRTPEHGAAVKAMIQNLAGK